MLGSPGVWPALKNCSYAQVSHYIILSNYHLGVQVSCLVYFVQSIEHIRTMAIGEFSVILTIFI